MPVSSILKYFWTPAQGRGDEFAEFCNWLYCMIKQSLSAAYLILFLLTLSACSLSGPKREDVVNVSDALCRSVIASIKNDPNPTEHSHYSNAADVTFKSSDNTSIHRLSYYCDTDNGSFSMKGVLTLTNYYDSISGYSFQGIYRYELKIPKNYDHHNWSGKATIEMQSSGGEISDISTVFHKKEGGGLTYEHYTINGRSYHKSLLNIASGFAETLIDSSINNPCATM